MRPGQPAKVVGQVYAALRIGDLPALATLIDPNVTVRQTAVLPWGGTFHGLDGYRQFVAGVFRHLDAAVTVERTVEAGDQVAVIGHTSGAVRATGRAFHVPLVHLYTVREGLVVEAVILIDTPAMLAALAAAHA